MTNDRFATPGQYIAALLDERGWDKQVLTAVLAIDNAGVSRLISGKKRVDAPTALALGEAFNLPPEGFLQIQQSYDLKLARLSAPRDEGRASRAALFANLPISEMIHRGWLNVESVRNVPRVESELARFFGTGSASDIERLPHAAKKTNVAEDVTPTQLAWIYRVKQIARGMIVSRFSRAATLLAIERCNQLLLSAEEIRNVPRILSEAGIRFVLVEALKGSKIDGVCCWLGDESPVIGMSLRFDRIDNFWFVMRHEMEHVLRGHGKRSDLLDAELDGERGGTGAAVPDDERVANLAAANFCVPEAPLESFIARKEPLFSERDLLGFSHLHQLHPGLVIGQLQRKTERYDLFRKHLVKVRSIVSPNAMVDGWGDMAPILT